MIKSSMRAFGNMPKRYPKKLMINNEFVNSVSNKTFKTIDPSTEETICRVQKANKQDVDIAVQAARNAFESGEWSNY